MVNVIVAGANGFIGKNLVNSLLAKGYSVTALDARFDEELLSKVSCIDVKGRGMDDIAEELAGKKYGCFFNLAWMGTSGPMRADYNIQIEGKLHGRACSGLAGLAEGTAIESHITCNDFDPELVSVSGIYKYGDSFPKDFYHQPVHIHCKDDEMKYEVINKKN